MPACKAKFKNSTSGTKIIRTYAEFYYSDGTSSRDPANGEPGEVDIGPGEAGYRFASFTNKCVKDSYMFMVWEGGYGGTRQGTAPANQCWTQTGIVLSESSFVPKDSKEEGPYLELKKEIQEPGESVPYDEPTPQNLQLMAEEVLKQKKTY